ncbi:MAG: carbonic anhydrase, partial [Promethearchaeota archaeon]
MTTNIEELLVKGNLLFQKKISEGLESVEIKDPIPKCPLLILTCMDPRIDVHRIFQLNPGDSFILRNAGNLYTKDTIRSILLAVYAYHIENIVVLGHLDCGMARLNLLDLQSKIPLEFLPSLKRNTLDIFAEVKDFFKPIVNEVRNVRDQIALISNIFRNNRRKLSRSIQITGLLYDVNTGLIFEHDKFSKLISMEDFKEKYQEIIYHKKIQFNKFLITIEKETTPPEEKKINILVDNLKQGENELIRESMIEKNENLLEEREVVKENINSPIIQNLMPRIQVPRIHFSGIKVYI